MLSGVRGHDDAEDMHAYKTIRRHMRINLTAWCFPASAVRFVEEIERPRVVQKTKLVRTHNDLKKQAQACVRLVLQSEWAKIDIATYSFYSDVYEHPNREDSSYLSIESAPIVQSRAAFVGSTPQLWSLFVGAPCITKQGDVVDIPCAGRPSQVE